LLFPTFSSTERAARCHLSKLKCPIKETHRGVNIFFASLPFLLPRRIIEIELYVGADWNQEMENYRGNFRWNFECFLRGYKPLINTMHRGQNNPYRSEIYDRRDDQFTPSKYDINYANLMLTMWTKCVSTTARTKAICYRFVQKLWSS
jgi:hypothetical protein